MAKQLDLYEYGMLEGFHAAKVRDPSSGKMLTILGTTLTEVIDKVENILRSSGIKYTLD